MQGQIGFIGAGAMGTALIRGLLAAGLVTPEQILAADVNPEQRLRLQDQYGISVAAGNSEVIASCPAVVLAVKPQVVPGVLGEVGRKFTPGQLLLSVVAGWRLHRLEDYLPAGVATIRAMPNTPCLIGRGMTALAYGRAAAAHDRELAQSIFRAVGDVVELPENLFDAVTALSGCGPAYTFLILEALSDAGVKLGLPRGVALQLAGQALAGAAAMPGETGSHPAQLKDMVTSPGGATMAGVAVMEDAGLRGVLIRAVEAAWRRSQELGKEES